mmetsp:Transcript_27199/g.56516  ORF Transcript_27199/g.56516 Transcript_27199/m.56516 type:complete len:145 (+) Transcript_27199:1872-2306(+)
MENLKTDFFDPKFLYPLQGLRTLDSLDPSSVSVRVATIACNSSIGQQNALGQGDGKKFISARRVSLLSGILRRRSAPTISVDSNDTLPAVLLTEPAASTPDNSSAPANSAANRGRGHMMGSADPPLFSMRGARHPARSSAGCGQ